VVVAVVVAAVAAEVVAAEVAMVATRLPVSRRSRAGAGD
jgi:hypothetical protein